jgi:hypothetical protein
MDTCRGVHKRVHACVCAHAFAGTDSEIEAALAEIIEGFAWSPSDEHADDLGGTTTPTGVPEAPPVAIVGMGAGSSDPPPVPPPPGQPVEQDANVGGGREFVEAVHRTGAWGCFTLTPKQPGGQGGRFGGYQASCRLQKRNDKTGCKQYIAFRDGSQAERQLVLRKLVWWCSVAQDDITDSAGVLRKGKGVCRVMLRFAVLLSCRCPLVALHREVLTNWSAVARF